MSMSAVFEGVLALTSASPRGMVVMLAMTVVGAGVGALGALQLPAWLSARRRQFAAIAEYARRATEPDEP
jgi:hypothetical protein